MKKVYYDFRESGRLTTVVTISGLISLVASAVFFLMGGDAILTNPRVVGNDTYTFWCIFFLLLGIVLFLINISIHKICKDVAMLLKEIEEKKLN